MQGNNGGWSQWDVTIGCDVQSSDGNGSHIEGNGLNGLHHNGVILQPQPAPMNGGHLPFRLSGPMLEGPHLDPVAHDGHGAFHTLPSHGSDYPIYSVVRFPASLQI